MLHLEGIIIFLDNFGRSVFLKGKKEYINKVNDNNIRKDLLREKYNFIFLRPVPFRYRALVDLRFGCAGRHSKTGTADE